MADDESVLTSKILLRHAASKSKAKSWLVASLGAEEQTDPTNAASSTREPDEGFPLIQGNDENAGVGVVRKIGESDDLSNRQLLSANGALRKQLLSKDAYKKYNQGSKHGLDASKPKPSNVWRKAEDDDSGEEDKGRSSRASRVNHKKVVVGDNKTAETTERSTLTPTNSNPPARRRKRPGSYLDQVLAERERKSRKKGNAKAEND